MGPLLLAAQKKVVLISPSLNLAPNLKIETVFDNTCR
jgi:hypothetical protein